MAKYHNPKTGITVEAKNSKEATKPVKQKKIESTKVDGQDS